MKEWSIKIGFIHLWVKIHCFKHCKKYRIVENHWHSCYYMVTQHAVHTYKWLITLMITVSVTWVYNAPIAATWCAIFGPHKMYWNKQKTSGCIRIYEKQYHSFRSGVSNKAYGQVASAWYIMSLSIYFCFHNLLLLRMFLIN